MDVLFSDNHCIAVVKPAGMPVQPDPSGDESLLEHVERFVREEGNKPGKAFVALVHRLDRPVGGVVIFGKTSKGAARLSEQFREHSVRKVYWAMVEGVMEGKEGRIEQWLRKDAVQKKAFVCRESVPGAQHAVLSWRVLERVGGKTLVEVVPESGRFHQIRCGMASLGHPIVGDMKYGAAPTGDYTIRLWAYSLTFRTPVGEREVTVSAHPPWVQ